MPCPVCQTRLLVMTAGCMAQLLSCLGKQRNVQKRLESRSADDFTMATITLMRVPRPVHLARPDANTQTRENSPCKTEDNKTQYE